MLAGMLAAVLLVAVQFDKRVRCERSGGPGGRIKCVNAVDDDSSAGRRRIDDDDTQSRAECRGSNS